ncbi:twin-arginine translocation signal domain-containing protein [Salinarchaeum laminariae]|uniref:twin-arginine translocation signal domain-containing protein n=1 Tax=Salinarchaeum laminariae TaxID=869888 RepID=UPI0020BE1BE7|nr:twin-arginine translocation signal domain-containing protein [Salinarchaeum laminariae]
MAESRRRFLKSSGALVGTGILASAAGCTGILGGGGGGGGGAIPGSYTNWQYAPGTIRDTDNYFFNGIAPIEINEYEDSFDEEWFDTTEAEVESQYELLDIDFDEVETVMSFDGSTAQVLLGYEAEREDVTDALEENEFEEGEEYEGYQMFVGPNEQRAVALDDSDIVIGRSTSMTGGTDNPIEGNGQSGSKQDLRSINYGESWNSQIEESDPEYSGLYHNEPVEFEATAGDIITIHMEASEADPYLVLDDPNGDSVRNDGGLDGSAQISELELEQSGTYTINAQTYSSGETTPYTLTLTLVGTPIDPRTVAKSIVDTGAGKETRYADDSEAYAELTSTLTAGTFVSGRTFEETEETAEEMGQFEGAVARGSSVTVNGETSDVEWVITFADADDVDTGDVEDWTEDAEDETFDDVDDISISTSGRSVVISGTMDTDDYGN